MIIGQTPVIFTGWTDLSILRSCRAPVRLAAVVARADQSCSLQEALSTPLPSPSFPPPLSEPLHVRAASKLSALLRQATSSAQITFQIQPILIIAGPSCQSCDAQHQHSGAPSPRTSDRRASSAARAARVPDEQRRGPSLEPILSSFSVRF